MERVLRGTASSAPRKLFAPARPPLRSDCGAPTPRHQAARASAVCGVAWPVAIMALVAMAGMRAAMAAAGGTVSC
jgi:hypothetical protein